MNPKVSAIVLSYNHEKFIHQALTAVFSQDYSNYEIIIRDDASSDKSSEIISAFIKTHKPLSHNVTVEFIMDSQNLGLIKSYNSALTIATGNIIAIFAGDDISDHSRIRKTVDLLTKFNIDIVAVDARVIDGENKVLSDSFYCRNGRDLFDGIGEREGDIRIINSKNHPSRQFSIGGFGYTYNRSLLDSFGGLFPENIFFEDEFLSFLAILNNGILFSYQPYVLYRQHSANLSHSELDSENKIKSLLLPKQKECKLHEIKINYLKGLDKSKKTAGNLLFINRTEKILSITQIHICYIQGNGIVEYLPHLINLSSNKEVKARTKMKWIIFCLFPWLIKKELTKEFNERFQHHNFD